MKSKISRSLWRRIIDQRTPLGRLRPVTDICWAQPDRFLPDARALTGTFQRQDRRLIQPISSLLVWAADLTLVGRTRSIQLAHCQPLSCSVAFTVVG
jgi:hypothetical protein